MTPDAFIRNALEPALRLLPSHMDTPNARAMVLTICLQESRLEHRRQIGGPARSYAQMEQGGGVHGVLSHSASKPYIQTVLAALDYDGAQENACWTAIEHNDILAAAFARLLLWTLPSPLPGRESPDIGWAQYSQAWRPGKPHRESWNAFWDEAWALAEAVR